MWQSKNISYFNIYKKVVLYLFKFIVTLYQLTAKGLEPTTTKFVNEHSTI